MTVDSGAAFAFGTQLIGRTEKALNAILARLLAGTGLTERQWVALTLVVTGDEVSRDVLGGRLATALRVDRPTADALLADLSAAGLVGATTTGAVRAEERGAALWRDVRADIERVTGQLWGDLPPADLSVAGRVLGVVLTRADAMASST